MKLFFRILFSSALFFLSTGCYNSFAQTVKLNSNISFTANNITVSDALEALTHQTGIAFSYNPDQLPANKIVRVDISNKPLIEVLGAILGSTAFGYRQMGNQIIIYRSRDNNNDDQDVRNQADTPVEPSLQNKVPETITTIPQKPDTVVKYMRDTIKVTEYVLKHDTVYQKVETGVSGKEIFNSTADLSKELTPEWKFDAGINAGYFLPKAGYNASSELTDKLKQYENSYSHNVFSGTAGFVINASYSKFTIASGITATLFSQKLDYTYLKESGGYFRKDTLDKYFTLTETDTTWYYILDSTYLPKDNESFNYKINNHLRYLEIPLTLQYNAGIGNILVFGQAGIITGLFSGNDGQLIKVMEDGVFSIEDLEARKVLFSWTVGAGVALPVGSKFIFRTSLNLRKHLNSVYKDFPIETKYMALGLNAGLTYKLY